MPAKKFLSGAIFYLTTWLVNKCDFRIILINQGCYEMPRTLTAQNSKFPEPSFPELWQLIENFVEDIPPLQSRGKRPLQMTFEHQLKSLILCLLYTSDAADE